jgi:hypothetical protein
MLSGFENAPEGTIRAEILFTLAMQAILTWTLGLTAAGWLTWGPRPWTDDRASDLHGLL